MRDTINVLVATMIDPDGDPGLVVLPVSKYRSGGLAGSIQATQWGPDGKIDKASDKLPASHSDVPRSHFVDDVRYLVWHLNGGSKFRAPGQWLR